MWTEQEAQAVEFVDADGTSCELSANSFERFLATAKVSATGIPVFRLEVRLHEGSALRAASMAGAPAPLSPSPAPEKGQTKSRRSRPRAPAGTSSKTARSQWKEDNRDLDELVKAVGVEKVTKPAEANQKRLRGKKATKKAHAPGKSKRVKEGAKDAADEDKEEDDDMVDEEDWSDYDEAEAERARQDWAEFYEVLAFPDKDVPRKAPAENEKGGQEEEEDAPNSAEQVVADSAAHPPADVPVAEAAPEAQEDEIQEKQMYESDASALKAEPCELWPATPDYTPPVTPRQEVPRHEVPPFDPMQPVVWVPVPVWVPAMDQYGP